MLNLWPTSFPSQQNGPDSTYDLLTEQNTGTGEITKVGTDTSGTGNSFTLTFSHTLVSGTARIVIVSIGIENGNTIDISTVTYGGIPMTLAVERITGTSGFRFLGEIWYILVVKACVSVYFFVLPAEHPGMLMKKLLIF